MPSLTGNKPNQVPTNGDLGTLAFQDANSVSVGSVTYSGNINFTGTGNRITGDFSNATIANRVGFQSSTTNGNTDVQVLPNGTAVISGIRLNNNSDLTNAGYVRLSLNSTEASLSVDRNSVSGTYIPLGFNTGGSERLRIDTSGNVGIGTSSPSSNLEVYGASSAVSRVTAGSDIFEIRNTGSEVRLAVVSADPMTFRTSNVEAMRITSDGDLLVGTTSWSSGSNGISLGNNSNSRILITNSADFGLEIYGATTNRIGFAASNSASRVGSITVNTTNTAYNTSSDYRLKENIAPMTGALEKVALLKPCTYTWKVDGSQGEGFIAHELAEVVPQAVTGEKDGVDKDGNPDYQAIDVSFLVATLTAAIQEQQAMIEELKTKVAALESN